MKAEVVSYSQPAKKFLDLGLKTLQDLVVYKARVSNPTNQFNMLTGEKLVDYLIRNKHWSPLEMVSVCMEIETTRDIARQILRHRSFSFQEFSQRYAEVQEFDFRECRMQDEKNRQNSIPTIDNEVIRVWEGLQKRVMDDAQMCYQIALSKGIAKEQARALLPEGMAMSRMYMNGTLRSWLHYIEIRTDVATQKEHRDVALECKKALAELCPTIIKDFM